MAAKKELWEGMRVLAIDEDRVCLKILEAKLRRFNHDVTPVKNGKAALRALGKAREPFDLVITELYMPDMDALDLIRRIAVGMGIPVVVLSAYEDTKMVRNALISSEACSYLAKPVFADQLKNIWQHVLRRKNELARNHKDRGNTVANQQVPNPMAAFISNTTPVGGFNQQIAPLDIARNTSSTEMLNGPGSGSNTSRISLPSLQTGNSVTLTQLVNGVSCNSSALPNIEANSSVVPAQMLNAGNVVGTLPVQEGTADQQALDGQLIDNDDYSTDDIFNLLDQNVIEDDPLFKNSFEDDALLENFIEDDDLLKNSIVDDDLLKNSVVDDDLLNNSVQDDALLKSFFEDDDFLKNSIGDDDRLKNFIEDDALKNFSEVDDLLNGNWF